MTDKNIFPVISVDLDSTLADTRHRKGIIEQFTSKGLPIDWTVYAKACANDQITGFGVMLRAIQHAVPWVAVSGRSEGSREATEAWLKENDLRPEAVYLEDGQTDLHSAMGHAAWKAHRVAEVADMHPTIVAHVDDWAQVADALEAAESRVRGVTVVPPGMIPVLAHDGESPDNPL